MMISLQTLHRGSATRAGHYYSDQKDDYYSRDGRAAQWQGAGSAALGLTGDVTPQQFVAALRGDIGFMDSQLGQSVRKDAKARAGLDVTFSAPKSVSIQALIGKDPLVLEAHDKAVTKALQYLEEELVRARQKEDGVSRSEKTGNAIIAKFRHETARPTAFDEADPQLHTHAVVMNATRRADGTWVAMANEQIYRSKIMLDLVYKSELAFQLEKAGYGLRYEKDNFELAHISRGQIEHFSKRGMTVEAELARMGKSRKSASRELKQTITLSTRESKRPEIGRSALQERWEHDAKNLHLDLEAARRHAELVREGHLTDEHQIPPPLAPEHEAYEPDSSVDLTNQLRAADDRGKAPADSAMKASTDPASRIMRDRLALESVSWAIRHISERDATMTRDVLTSAAMNHSIGTGLNVEDIQRAIQNAVHNGHLVQGAPVYRLDLGTDNSNVFSREEWVKRIMSAGSSEKDARRNVRRAILSGGLVLTDVRYTTQAAREREKRILQIEREGRNAMAPILSMQAAKMATADKGLKPGQLTAAELILTTSNRVVGVQGLAGVGKSHMLRHVKGAMEAAGYTVKSVAPYSSQVRSLRELGVEAVTVAAMLEAEQDRFTLDEKTVLVIDEAAVVPSRQMEKILQQAEKAGARVVMMGDKDQTKAIEAGRPMHQLQDEGMQTALMGDIVRQTNPELRRAVEIAAAGRPREAVHILQSQLNSVVEIKDDADRYSQIAGRYASLSRPEQRETLIVTGTNKSRNAINNLVHEKLGLAGKGFDYTLLTRVDTTQAQRRSARYFSEGQIVQPERSYKVGLRSDAQYVVKAIDSKRNRVEVEDLATRQRIVFNPARATKLSVYERVQAELSAGDKVRITRNDARLDLVNGARYDVLTVTPTTVRLGQIDREGTVTREVVLPANVPLHLDRAYATTVHSAQGLSETGVILNQETYSRTSKADVFYVAISRAREWVQIYTDDVTKLPGAVSRREEKAAALDIGIAQRGPTDGKQRDFSVA